MVFRHHFLLMNYVTFLRTDNVHVNRKRIETGLKLVSINRYSWTCERGVCVFLWEYIYKQFGCNLQVNKT